VAAKDLYESEKGERGKGLRPERYASKGGSHLITPHFSPLTGSSAYDVIRIKGKGKASFFSLTPRTEREGEKSDQSLSPPTPEGDETQIGPNFDSLRKRGRKEKNADYRSSFIVPSLLSCGGGWWGKKRGRENPLGRLSKWGGTSVHAEV